MIKFNYYPSNVKITRPLGKVSLYNMLQVIKNPNKSMKMVFEKLRSAEGEEKRKLKEHLLYFTPAVRLKPTGRAYKDIVGFTGYLVVDYDKIEDAEEGRDFLFDNFDFVIASWVSSSGNGCRAIVKIPVVSSVEEYKELFFGLADAHLDHYEGFDIAPQNPCLPLFMSMDPGLRMRTDATVWTGKREMDKRKRVLLQPWTPGKPDADESKKAASIRHFTNKINSISDNGHPQVRRACFIFGGRVGAGYLTLGEAENIAHQAIAENSYLSKGTSGYQATATQMLNQGADQPLIFD